MEEKATILIQKNGIINDQIKPLVYVQKSFSSPTDIFFY